MSRTTRLTLLLVALLAIVAVLWWQFGRPRAPHNLVLYGNIDLRQVDLAFNDSERVAEVLVQEGDHVRAGQLLARLDTSRLEPQVAKAQAQVAAQQAGAAALQRGNRPEEIAQARANVERGIGRCAPRAGSVQRMQSLSERSSGRALSRQDLDAAKQAADARRHGCTSESEGARRSSRSARASEDIAQAEAQLRADEADLALRAAESRQRRAARAARCRGALAPHRAGRHGLAAAAGLHAGDHRSEMGARLRRRAPTSDASAKGMCASVSVDSFPAPPLRRLGRLHLAGGGVHAEDGRDDAVALEPGL